MLFVRYCELLCKNLNSQAQGLFGRRVCLSVCSVRVEVVLVSRVYRGGGGEWGELRLSWDYCVYVLLSFSVVELLVSVSYWLESKIGC